MWLGLANSTRRRTWPSKRPGAPLPDHVFARSRQRSDHGIRSLKDHTHGHNHWAESPCHHDSITPRQGHYAISHPIRSISNTHATSHPTRSISKARAISHPIHSTSKRHHLGCLPLCRQAAATSPRTALHTAPTASGAKS